LLAVLSMVTCGGSDSPSNRAAALALSMSPSPIQEGPCPPAHCGTLAHQDEAQGSLRVTETGGLGVRLSGVALSLRADGTGTVIAVGQFDAAAITQMAGTVRVEANGQLTLPVGVHYDVAAGGHPATLIATASAVDDLGHTLSQSTTVAVTP